MTGNTNHTIYKERGRLNKQIGLVLGAFVILVMIATVAKLSSPVTDDVAVENTQ